ncbi:hypothetical protein [Micromonospora cremea]|uniref:Uncharacterized protein n=1 Tax=Micromonospora cremea TaxID=709881 RepID=A0A1N6AQG0_9ACTN|nr:hypothetical protein [Micromonospora cremea]SIN36168.1 hypothetical protein SAMN04489832_5928 [Micromonospora cremea]
MFGPQRTLGSRRTRFTIAVLATTIMVVPLAAPAAAGTAGMASTAVQEPTVVGAYTQVTVDGRYVGRGLEGVGHALTAYAAIHKVTGDPHQRAVFEALLDRMLTARPSHMNALLGAQVLEDPFLLSHPALVTNVRGFASGLVEKFAATPEQILRQGDIRTLTGNASFLVAYAKFLENEFREAHGQARVDLWSELRDIDEVGTALLDRLVELQFTLGEATDRFNNPRLVGGFPHLVDTADGTMGSWDVTNWSPAMLSIEQYSAVRALAEGFGRYHRPAYERAAAAAARPLLATDEIDPELIYAGSPAGFPLDGADFQFGEETGEHPYLITYGWSPNAIGDLGTALKALIDNRVTVPRSPKWAETYWKGSPPDSILDPRSFRDGLAAKVAYTHRFMEATQLPVPSDFAWIDVPHATFPGTGDDDIHRGGWYDGSGRGAMSAVYSRIAIHGYVASGGRNVELLMRAGQWWDNMIVWT